MIVDEKLIQFAASDRQREAISTYLEHGSYSKAAEVLMIHETSVQNLIKRVKRRAALAGWSPENDMKKTVPEPFIVKGTSTLYDDSGKQLLQWVKTSVDLDKKREIIEELVESLCSERLSGKADPITPPKATSDRILTLYPIADHHIGMYSWCKETGADYDCDIASMRLCQAIDSLVSRSPESQQAVIANLGDFFHTDTEENRTRRSGNALDVDSRWAKVLKVGIDTMIYCIDRVLARHENVTVINQIGNHDDHSAVMLSLVLGAYYKNEPRLTVPISYSHFDYYRFHKVLLGFHHGHEVKPQDLGGVMSTDRAGDWGETIYRHWFTGHIHHETRKDYRGYTHESKTTLAANDAYAHNNGYRSQRAMESIYYDREFGEEGRSKVSVRYLDSSAE